MNRWGTLYEPGGKVLGKARRRQHDRAYRLPGGPFRFWVDRWGRPTTDPSRFRRNVLVKCPHGQEHGHG